MIQKVLFTIFCIIFALIPEIGMYMLYGWVQPDSPLAKIAMFAVFWFIGLGMCILFAYLAVLFWLLVMKEM